jgi:hypothetical protein
MFRCKGLYWAQYIQTNNPDGSPSEIGVALPMDCCLLHDHEFLNSLFWMWASGAITEKKFKGYLLKNNLVPYGHRNAKKVIIQK